MQSWRQRTAFEVNPELAFTTMHEGQPIPYGLVGELQREAIPLAGRSPSEALLAGRRRCKSRPPAAWVVTMDGLWLFSSAAGRPHNWSAARWPTLVPIGQGRSPRGPGGHRVRAERAGISRVTLRNVERGAPTVALGIYLELAVLVGLNLFGTDRAGLEDLADRSRDRLALLPERVRQSSRPVRDDF